MKFRVVADGTPQVLAELAADPTASVDCIFECRSQAAMAVWYMPLGCAALHPGSYMERYMPSARSNFRVQPLCLQHSERREPLYDHNFGQPPVDEATAEKISPRLLRGGHLLVDMTYGAGAEFPQRPWAECTPHWSDTADNGVPLPPALELGYDMARLREFAVTDLGRAVFFGYDGLLANPGGGPAPAA